MIYRPRTSKFPPRAELMYLCLLFMPARARFPPRSQSRDSGCGWNNRRIFAIRRTRRAPGNFVVWRARGIRAAGKREAVSAPGPPFAKEIKRFRAICSDAKREARVYQPRRHTFASCRAAADASRALPLPPPPPYSTGSITFLPFREDIRMWNSGKSLRARGNRGGPLVKIGSKLRFKRLRDDDVISLRWRRNPLCAPEDRHQEIIAPSPCVRLKHRINPLRAVVEFPAPCPTAVLVCVSH